MSLEELLIHDQGVHRKHINTLLTEIYKTFSGRSPYFVKSIFTKKDVTYNLRTSNLLTLFKINKKRVKTPVKGFKNKLVRNWQEITCPCAVCRF